MTSTRAVVNDDDIGDGDNSENDRNSMFSFVTVAVPFCGSRNSILLLLMLLLLLLLLRLELLLEELQELQATSTAAADDSTALVTVVAAALLLLCCSCCFCRCCCRRRCWHGFACSGYCHRDALVFLRTILGVMGTGSRGVVGKSRMLGRGLKLITRPLFQVTKPQQNRQKQGLGFTATAKPSGSDPVWLENVLIRSAIVAIGFRVMRA